MATGVMNMSLKEFESMTPADFLTKLKGFNWKLERQAKMEAALAQKIIAYCGHLKKGKKIHLSDLFKEANLDPKNPFYRQFLGLPM